MWIIKPVGGYDGSVGGRTISKGTPLSFWGVGVHVVLLLQVKKII